MTCEASDPLVEYLALVERQPKLDYVTFSMLLTQSRRHNRQARRQLSDASLRIAAAATVAWAEERGRTANLDMYQEANAALMDVIDRLAGAWLDDFAQAIESAVIERLDHATPR